MEFQLPDWAEMAISVWAILASVFFFNAKVLLQKRKQEHDFLLHEKKQLQDSLSQERDLRLALVTRRRDALREATLHYCIHFAEYRYKLMKKPEGEALTSEEEVFLFKSLTFLEFMVTLVESDEVDEKIFKELYGSMILKHYDRWFRLKSSFAEEMRTLAGQETLFEKVETFGIELNAERLEDQARQSNERVREFRKKSKGHSIVKEL